MKQNEIPFYKTLLIGFLIFSPFVVLAQPNASNDIATGNEDQIISIAAIQSNDKLFKNTHDSFYPITFIKLWWSF